MTAPLPQSLNASLCPLCGRPNACGAAAEGRFDVACWCTTVRFPPELLARVPAGSRGQACICRACVEAFDAALDSRSQASGQPGNSPG